MLKDVILVLKLFAVLYWALLAIMLFVDKDYINTNGAGLHHC